MISIVGTPQSLDVPFLYEDSGINKIGGTYYYSYVSNNHVHDYVDNPAYPAAAIIRKSGAITYMTSNSPLGPYTLKKMILPNPDEMFNQQRSGGSNNHHAMFEFKGKYYIVYHSRLLEIAMGVPASIPREGYRSAHIDEVTIQPDGTIDEISGSRKGAAQVGRFSPYQWTSAATIGNQAGINTAAVTGGQHMKVTDIDSGDWIALYGVNFGSAGASKLSCRVTPPGSGKGVIQIKLDGLDGKAVGYVNVEPGQPPVITANLLRTVTGVHDLVFVFYSEDGQGFEFEQWQFIR
jgi:arabinoxylan arabinofuranohydrolase